MKYLIYLISIILLLGINLGLFTNLPIKGQIPNLLFLLTLFFSLEKKDFDFFFIALVSGLFLDFFSASFFGGFTLAFLILALSLHIFVSNLLVFELNWKNLSIIILTSLIITNLSLWFYGYMAFKFNFSADFVGLKVYISNFLPSFIYNILLLYPMYLVFNFLKRIINNLNILRRGRVR